MSAGTAAERVRELIRRCSVGPVQPQEVMVERTDLEELIDFATVSLTAQATATMLRQNVELEKQCAELGKACELFKDKILELERTVDRATLARTRLQAELDLAQAMHTEASRQRDECAEALEQAHDRERRQAGAD